MPAPPPEWRTIPLSTSDEEALSHYRRGVAALVAGASHAVEALEAAVAADPRFHIARVALAVARATRGVPFEAPAELGGLSVPERHHVEIVLAFARDDHRRAADLRREHVLEYPADLLVVWAPNLCPTVLLPPTQRHGLRK